MTEMPKNLEENKGETRFKEMHRKPLCGQNFQIPYYLFTQLLRFYNVRN